MSHPYSELQIEGIQKDFDPHIMLNGDVRDGDSFPTHLKGMLHVRGGGPLTIGAELKTISVEGATLHIVYVQDASDKWVDGYVWLDSPLPFDVKSLTKLFDDDKQSAGLALAPQHDVLIANTDLPANKDALRGDVAFYYSLASMEIDKHLEPAEEMEHWIEQVHELHEFLFGAVDYHEYWTRDQSDLELAQFLLQEHRRKEVMQRAIDQRIARLRSGQHQYNWYEWRLAIAKLAIANGIYSHAIDRLIDLQHELETVERIKELGEDQRDRLSAEITRLAAQIRDRLNLYDTDLSWLHFEVGTP